MKVVFLIIDYVPHQVLTIKNIINNYKAEVYAYHVGRFTNAIPDLTNFKTTSYHTLKKKEILEQILNLQPDLVIVSGWMIPEYIWVAKRLKKKLNVPIVSYSDTPWYGTIRQKINTLISPFHVKKAFTHMWVAGIYQFEYASRLGFNKENILFNSLSADTKLFEAIDLEKKRINYPKNFVYIGRFSPEKGLHKLIEAWNNIPHKNGWSLTLIGDGPLKNNFNNDESIVVKDYMDQELLINELRNSGCLILPSLHEPWALVLHEAAVAGLPIICTNICGAVPHFVLNNYNGLTVPPNSSLELQNAMKEIIAFDNTKLLEFSFRSRTLGQRIDPEISLQSLINVLK
jgi:glycosyltransferase involved in cell wall biosynthesis